MNKAPVETVHPDTLRLNHIIKMDRAVLRTLPTDDTGRPGTIESVNFIFENRGEDAEYAVRKSIDLELAGAKTRSAAPSLPMPEVCKEDMDNLVETMARAADDMTDVQRAAEAIAIAQDAIDLMARFHSHAQPDETPDMNALFPALAFREFVDEHARLMYRMAQFKRRPTEPAYMRLRVAASELFAVIGARGQIDSRNAAVEKLANALYETDNRNPETAKPVYLTDASTVGGVK